MCNIIYWFAEEREYSGTYVRLIKTLESNYMLNFNGSNKMGLVNELGDLLALQKVGWDFTNPKRLMGTGGDDHVPIPDGFSGGFEEDHFGWRSPTPLTDRERCYEIGQELKDKLDMMASIF